MAGLVTATFSTLTLATPVTYQESVGGDLDVDPSTHLLTLDLGANTVSGRTGSQVAATDFDSFAFIVPVGKVLASAGVSVTDAGGNVGDIVKLVWALGHGSAYGGALVDDLTVLSPGIDSIGLVPLGAGTYDFSHFQVGYGGGFPLVTPAFSDYVFTLTVADAVAVPEPGSLALAGVALAALWRQRRRLA